jgi:hypothetical protein
LAAHGLSLQSAFISDDVTLIVGNRLVTESVSWGTIFRAPYFDSEGIALLYRPAVIASFALTHRLFGLLPVAFHAGNLALHCLNTLLLALVVWRLFGRGRLAALAAGVFAVHPLNAEAVGAVFARTDLLSTLGQLIALTCWIEGRNAGRRVHWGLGLCAGLGLALLSKESSVSFPGIILAIGVITRRPWQSTLLWTALAAAVVALYLLLRLALFGVIVRNTQVSANLVLVNPIVELSRAHQILAGMSLIPLSLAIFAWPATLSLDHSYGQIVFALSAGFFARAALGLALIWVTVRQCVAPSPNSTLPEVIRIGAAWFLVSWLLVSNILLPGSTVFGERLMLFPGIGLALIAAWLIDSAWTWLEEQKKHRVAVIGVAALALAGVSRSAIHQAALRTHESAMLAAAEASPRSAKALADAGGVLIQRAIESGNGEDLAMGGELTREALDIYPHMGWAWVNLANAELRNGNSCLARIAFERAMHEDPAWIGEVGPVWRRLVSENWDGDRSALRWELMLWTAPNAATREDALARLKRVEWSGDPDGPGAWEVP